MEKDELRDGGESQPGRSVIHVHQHSHLLAGGAAGLAGLLVFLVFHHLWIMPIWFIAPIGTVFSSVGGILIGRAYGEVKSALPGGILREGSIIAAATVVLLPSILLAELRQPLFTLSSGNPLLSVSMEQAVLHFILELPLPAAMLGAALGWYVGRSRKAALSVAAAALVFALGPGHNIPFLGGTLSAGKGIAILGAVVGFSSIVLVEIDLVLFLSR